MKRFIVAAVAALACTCASAGNTEVRFSDIQITSTAQDVQFVGGTLTANLSAGAIGAPADSVANITTTFATWPSSLDLSISSHGASAGVSIGPSFLDVWGESGLYGSYGASAALKLNFLTAPIADDVPFAESLSVAASAFAQIGAYFDPAGVIQAGLGVTGWSVLGGPPTIGELWAPYKFIYGNDGGLGYATWDSLASPDGYQFTRSFDLGTISARFSRDGHGTVLFQTTMFGRGPGEVVTPVPEPSTYALLLAGLAAVGFTAKRRKPVAAEAAACSTLGVANAPIPVHAQRLQRHPIRASLACGDGLHRRGAL